MKRPKKKILLKNKRTKYIIYILIPICSILLIAGLIYQFNKVIFKENERFIIKKINIDSRSNWKYKRKEIKDLLNIEEGISNSLSINTGVMRKQLLSIASISDVDIVTVFPDTLNITIFEKNPRALLFDRKSNFVVDYDCNVMDKANCLNKKRSLPIITGVSKNKSDVQFNDYLEELKPAMKLLEEIKTKYPKFDVKKIDLSHENKIEFTLFLFRKFYFVNIPKKSVTAYELQKIYSTLADILAKKGKTRNIDTTFEGQVIVK